MRAVVGLWVVALSALFVFGCAANSPLPEQLEHRGLVSPPAPRVDDPVVAVAVDGHLECFAFAHAPPRCVDATGLALSPRGAGAAVDIDVADGRVCAAMGSGSVLCWRHQGADAVVRETTIEADEVIVSSELVCALRRGGPLACWDQDGIETLAEEVEQAAISRGQVCARTRAREFGCAAMGEEFVIRPDVPEGTDMGANDQGFWILTDDDRLVLVADAVDPATIALTDSHGARLAVSQDLVCTHRSSGVATCIDAHTMRIAGEVPYAERLVVRARQLCTVTEGHVAACLELPIE